jgi:hypothetical protein
MKHCPKCKTPIPSTIPPPRSPPPPGSPFALTASYLAQVEPLITSCNRTLAQFRREREANKR